jgi:hypothetical protein
MVRDFDDLVIKTQYAVVSDDGNGRSAYKGSVSDQTKVSVRNEEINQGDEVTKLKRVLVAEHQDAIGVIDRFGGKAPI